MNVADEYATRDWLLEATNCFPTADVVTFAIEDDADGNTRFAVVDHKHGNTYVVTVSPADLVASEASPEVPA